MTDPDFFADLRVAYSNRLSPARQAAAAGIKVVGLIGCSVPIELVHAAGCFAVRLSAEPDGPTDLADRFMEVQHERETRSLFDRILRGDFDFCDAIVIATTSDADRFLFQYTKEIVRQGVRDTLPPVMAYDPMFGDLPAIRRYGLERTRELAARLALIGNTSPASEALADAISASRRKQALLNRLADLRSAAKMSGVDALHCMGAGHFMAPDAYESALAAALDRAEIDGKPRDARRVVIVPSAPLYHDRLHRVVEATGAVVIAEDDGWGARGMVGEIRHDGPPLEAVFDAYYELSPSPRAPRGKREAWLRRRLAQGGIDAVVAYVPPSDQDFGWSLPDLTALADANGTPFVLIRDDVLDAEGRQKIAGYLAGLLAPGVR